MKKVFYSFKYEDCWKVQQIRNIGVITNENFMEPYQWETVKRKGETAIKDWINNGLILSDIVVVLIGLDTYKSKWVRYEINTAIELGKKIVGIHINNLKDSSGKVSVKGPNPFEYVNNWSAKSAKVYDPGSADTYNEIKNILKLI